MIPTKKNVPTVPIQPDEIIDQVGDAIELGITMVHIHAKDKYGKNTYDNKVFEKIISGIRDIDSNIVICATTSGREYKSFAERSSVLELSGKSKPDMASLTLSSLNFNKQASINEPEMIINLAEKMKKNKIIPELEIFDLGMTNMANYLINKKIVPKKSYANIILGNISCSQADFLSLGAIISNLPKTTQYTIGGVGKTQLKANTMGIIDGSGVRVGLEDNYWFDDKRNLIASNLMLLQRVHNLLQIHEKKIMKPLKLRKYLNNF